VEKISTGGDFLRLKQYFFCALAGACAGAVTGLFGAGGGMVLVPLLSLLTGIEDDALFPASVAVILPVCLVCLYLRSRTGPLPWAAAAPYLMGSAAGGILAGLFGKKIPTVWLHRILGAFVLWGGIRYLC
jgi:uncharacterized membrane protein YfcA